MATEQTESEPHAAAASAAAPPPIRRALLWRITLVTLLIGLGITAALTILARNVYNREQQRLLSLRVRDASQLLTEALPAIQTPLGSAAELADATGGSATRFTQFMTPYVGPGKTFISASLWNLADPAHGPVAVLGLPPRLASSGIDLQTFFAKAAQLNTLDVIGMLSGSDRRLGYAYTTPGVTTGYAAYGEGQLPPTRHLKLPRSSSFNGLDYALYLGSSRDPANLLETDVNRLPLQGTTATESVRFGDNALTLTLAARTSLAGSLPRDLPWIILGGGIVLSVLAAGGALRLAERRRRAERLAIELESVAGENERLYAEQRTIAQTLQHALLPEELPQLPGLEAYGRYLPGERSIDVGGDWYDVIQVADRRVLLVVGDVSGHGLRAATTMAALRYAIHAYAAQGDPPDAILTKLSGLISVTRGGQLATILCAQIDLDRAEIAVCSAGHLPPLLINDGSVGYVAAEAGLPVGIDPAARYSATTVQTPPGATLIGFTDGLVERRGENLDVGLTRLREAATGKDGELRDLVSKLVSVGPAGIGFDDIAIVGVRWT